MSNLHKERLLSLDLFRGITMFLLLAEGTHIFYFLNAAVPGNIFFRQFLHAEWQGMHFWDLIQPYFTFIVGIGMAFSLRKRHERGDSRAKTFKHIMLRCLILFFLGIMLQSVYRERLVWDLYNILTQLSVSIFITFLIFRFPYLTQLIISMGLLIVTEILYRYISIDGFDQPFVKDNNFGTFIDLAIMGKTHPDGWVAFNCIPTTAHIIWGVLAGRVLLDIKEPARRIRMLGLVCITGWIIGYGMDWMGISPINKKIGTSSFVLVSGAWSLASFLFLYWIVDIRKYKKWVAFFSIIGMNPIFIYIFSRIIGRGFLNKFVPVFTKGAMSQFGLSEGIMYLSAFMIILGIEWYLCYWLYKRKIFIKI